MQTQSAFSSFAYEAQSARGESMSGTIDAAGVDDARRRLEGMNLRVLEIEPAGKPPRPRALKGDDFLAFNEQLSQLASAGMPIEQGLRLIAQDMRSRRLSATVNQIAEELERGTSLGEAFEKHHGQFPPLYGKLMEAGVKTGNLPAMLLNLGRHLELVYRMRAMLWRTFAYPIAVFIGLLLILIFLGHVVLPQFAAIYAEMGKDAANRVDWRTGRQISPALPLLTQIVLSMSAFVPALIVLLITLVVVLPIVWRFLRLSGTDRAVIDRFILPLPLLGPVLRRNLVARWCDAMKLAVDAGLDLPAAIALAGDAIGSARLKSDGERLIATMAAGMWAGEKLRVLPPTVPAAMALAVRQNQLSSTLGTLSGLYQRQAEIRLGVIPAILTPLLLIIIALTIGAVIAAVYFPIVNLFRFLTY
ncbi:MAG TPA: type II secretion system F family protein [Tepidisphaeraceae bacterium]|jgi:type IV pilus assembly protein PilC